MRGLSQTRAATRRTQGPFAQRAKATIALAGRAGGTSSVTPELRLRLSGAAEAIALYLLGAPRSRTRVELRFGNRGSLSVVIAGPKAGLWYDYETGEGGDLVALCIREERLHFIEAVQLCADLAGTRHSGLSPRHRIQASKPVGDLIRRVATAQTIYAAARDWRGTLAETYLRTVRRLSVPDDLANGVLRFSPEVAWNDDEGQRRRTPALVALYRDIHSDRPCGVRCTPLSHDGTKAHHPITFGRSKLAAIKLTPDEDVTLGIGICEGVETGLRVMATGFRPVWALGPAGGIAKFSVLAGICGLTIFADNDPTNAKGGRTGQDAAAECADRWAAPNREVIVATPAQPGDDWDDALRGIV